MNEPFFPLPLPHEFESGLATVLAGLIRRLARRTRPRGRPLEDSRLAPRCPRRIGLSRRRTGHSPRPPFPILPPPVF